MSKVGPAAASTSTDVRKTQAATVGFPSCPAWSVQSQPGSGQPGRLPMPIWVVAVEPHSCHVWDFSTLPVCHSDI